MRVKTFLYLEKRPDDYLIHTEEATIQLLFLTEDIVRIRASFDRTFIEKSYALVMTAWEDRLDSLLKEERKRVAAVTVPCEETEDTLIFPAKKIKVIIHKAPFHFRIYNQKDELIYSDLPERAFEIDQLGRAYHYNKIEPKTDHFYGFGEKTGHHDKKGRRMRMSAKDAIGHDPEFGDPLYKHIPFYIRLSESNQTAIGLFYNNSYESVFDMGNEISGYWDPYSYYQTDGNEIDLFFINGPSVKEVVNSYTDLTGKQAMPPKHSLGFTASTMYYAELDKNCDQEIYGVIEKHRANGMMIDNFKLASGYSSGEEDNLRYVFHWNKTRFPDPDAFFNKMNQLGINVIVNLKPGILEKHPFREEFEANDVFVKDREGEQDYYGRWWGGEGRFVDFLKASGRNTWKKMLKASILEKGTATVWNDNCEYDGIEEKQALCGEGAERGQIAELKPIQANMMAYTAKQAIKEVFPNKRPYIINRAGYAGIQRYAQTWAGDNLTDWRTLRYNIDTIIGMGLSGVANTGCDIGGFAGGAPDAELLLRWIQNGIFQPRFCINSANDDNTVTQPWMYDKMNPLIRKAFRLRYQMLPYLYSLMYQAHRTGDPILRPLFYEFQEDPNCYADPFHTFMVGSSLLVANVLEAGATTRTLYLPKGSQWFQLNEQFTCYEGGQVITISVGLEDIPMFLRADGIFVTSADEHQRATDTVKQIELLIGEGENQRFDLYEDDGHSNDFEQQHYKLTTIKTTGRERKTIQFQTTGTFDSTIEYYRLKVITKEKGAYWVTLDGQKLPQYLSRQDFEAATNGWYYDLQERANWIKFPRPSSPSFEVIVSTETFDLIGMSNE